jgi:hypothetical protein
LAGTSQSAIKGSPSHAKKGGARNEHGLTARGTGAWRLLSSVELDHTLLDKAYVEQAQKDNPSGDLVL